MNSRFNNKLTIEILKRQTNFLKFVFQSFNHFFRYTIKVSGARQMMLVIVETITNNVIHTIIHPDF